MKEKYVPKELYDTVKETLELANATIKIQAETIENYKKLVKSLYKEE